jgi:recombination DNA repair RAD52 pathway protein
MTETPKHFFGQAPYSSAESEEISSVLKKQLGPEYIRLLAN